MPTWQEFLSSSPQVCGGEICVTGTRIPVTVILDSLAEGAAKDEVLRSYPGLRVEHINAALAYAAELAPASDMRRSRQIQRRVAG